MARDDVNPLLLFLSTSQAYRPLQDIENSINPAGIYPFLRSFHSFAGRGLFMFRTLIVGITSAALLETLFAIVGGMALGVGSIPFIIGASVGFQGGLWLHYNHSLLQAMVALDDFPGLLLLHLDANFPLYRWRKRKWSGGFDGTRLGWLEKSMLVTAWQSAGAAVELGGLSILHEKVAMLRLVTGRMRDCGYAGMKADTATGDSNTERNLRCPRYCRKNSPTHFTSGN